MTVAWLTKPGLNDSAVRLVQRFCGTVVGVVIVGIILSLAWSDPFAMVVIGISTAVIVAFAAPNYLIATEGVTVFAVRPGSGLLRSTRRESRSAGGRVVAVVNAIVSAT